MCFLKYMHETGHLICIEYMKELADFGFRSVPSSSFDPYKEECVGSRNSSNIPLRQFHIKSLFCILVSFVDKNRNIVRCLLVSADGRSFEGYSQHSDVYFLRCFAMFSIRLCLSSSICYLLRHYTILCRSQI